MDKATDVGLFAVSVAPGALAVPAPPLTLAFTLPVALEVNRSLKL